MAVILLSTVKNSFSRIPLFITSSNRLIIFSYSSWERFLTSSSEKYKNILKEQMKDIKFPLVNIKNNLQKKEMKTLIDRQAQQITKLMIDSWKESSKIKPSVKTRRKKGKWPEKIKNLSIELEKQYRKRNHHC